MQAQLDQASVRVPEAGQILKINTRAGETVSNDGIVELDRTDQMYAVAEVYQSDINKVRSGQRSLIGRLTQFLILEELCLLNRMR
ncbi:MAG: HlyD family efflux transporter periplasmic adaptor subunit [Nostoc sp.]|uniref:HlyD family efflux transporter periplasmic adaptor subunit n=1 Tax=Nostoc sp. TaxID=1180 RepID=UPI002FF7EF7F